MQYSIKSEEKEKIERCGYKFSLQVWTLNEYVFL